MICRNCGFHNAPGDEFCGSCGQFLEWTGQPSDGQTTPDEQPATSTPPVTPPLVTPPAPAAASTRVAGGGPPTDETVIAPPPGTAHAAPPLVVPTEPTQRFEFAPRTASTIICWNCGRSNPIGRSFCQQCGERLAVDGPAAGAPVPVHGAGADGGGSRRMIAIAGGLLALVVLAGGALAVLLAGLGNGPGATPTNAALATITPSPTDTAIVVSPSPSSSLPPTEPPTAAPTEPPTASPTQAPVVTEAPTATPRPTRRPTPPPPPTAPPTPVNCEHSTEPETWLTLTVDDAQRRIVRRTAWCVHQVIFIAHEGEGQLKLFLTSPQNFPDLQDGRYGWLEANMPGDFSESAEYSPEVVYPFPYQALPPRTTVSFEVTCQTETCAGQVQIGYDEISAP